MVGALAEVKSSSRDINPGVLIPKPIPDKGTPHLR